MSAKLATLDLLKVKVFWNKGYDVKIYVNDITNKNLSRDSNYTVDVVMRLKFGNSSISSYHNFNFIMIWAEKAIFWGILLVKVQ